MNTPISYDRLPILDIIRGFTLFGILISNILLSYSGYLLLTPELTQNFQTAPLDKIIIFLEDIFVEGKFYSIFSFLFGVGFGLQLTRSDKNALDFFKIYRRRLFILLIIGIVHTLMWQGDILVLYALLGFILILFHNKSPRFILLSAFAAFSVPLIVDFLRFGIYLFTASKTDIFGFFYTQRHDLVHAFVTTNAQGSFGEIFKANLIAVQFRWAAIIITSRIFRVLGMFLLGLYAAKQNVFSNITQQQPQIKKLVIWGLSLGVILNLFYGVLSIDTSTSPSLHWLIKMICYTFGAPILALSYVGIMTLLYNNKSSKLADLFANAGKMALTNYLFQTTAGLLIFYNYGLGLYGQVSASMCLIFAILIFTLQIILSTLWLRFFNFGPLEWIWRSLTYKTRFPMVKTANITVT